MPKYPQQNGMVIFFILFLLLLSELIFLYFEHLFFQQQHLIFHETEKIRMQYMAKNIFLNLQVNLPEKINTHDNNLLEKPLEIDKYCETLHSLPDKWFGCDQIFLLKIKNNLTYKHLYILRLLLKFNGLEQTDQKEFLLS